VHPPLKGEQSGWLALQAGVAVVADAILIPEIPCDLRAVAANLKDKMSLSRPYGLVVVAEGARLVEKPRGKAKKPDRGSLKDSLSPLARETYPIAMGPWVRGGPPTAVDRQLGLAYGAGAVEALNTGENGVMVSFAPPDINFVPLTKAINKVRTVPADSEFIQIARLLNISLGGAI
jgi:6-phosphofructokinase 1